jgi:hypothetical protein
MIVDLIDDFFAEYPAAGASDKVDTAEADEVIDAIAKTVAEMTSQQDGVIRQQLIEDLMRAIMSYDAEFRRRGDLRCRLSREALSAVRIDLMSAFGGIPRHQCVSADLNFSG